MTIIYPGMDWNGTVVNTLDKTINGKDNANYPPSANNASKTALTWRNIWMNNMLMVFGTRMPALL